ncbi:sensor histidine kinase [Nonomuraea soli]|uniref:Signal transduction histidine kinase n=1 Tax=Nonomuraea soli TaxID=1032476 RepID=A0A7W0CSS7_9ACTN|nr:histidine kinase [Nonomuraea soli]MBA2896625.1 signal transduction histidine kinase [Nonomuraea soli]
MVPSDERASATPLPAWSPGATEARGVLMAPTLARTIVAVVFCGFAGIALLWVLELGHTGGEVALAAALLIALLSLQYFCFGHPGTDLRSPAAYAALGAQALLVYLPLLLFQGAWISLPSFLAGVLLLMFPQRVAWPLFALVVLGTGVAKYVDNGVWLDVTYILVNTATAGLYIYGLTRLARLVTALYEARDELARSAVAHERLRFARELNDSLGLSLSEITLKGQAALRLLGPQPDRAARELGEILEISRRMLADVRSIARENREAASEDLPADAGLEATASDTQAATRLAGGLVVAVMVGLFLQAVMRQLFQPQDVWELTLAAGCIAAALGLQVGYFSRSATRAPAPTGYLPLAVLAVLVYLPTLLFQQPWSGVQGFLAGSALLVLRPALGWSVFAAVVASMAWIEAGFGGNLPLDFNHVLVTMDLGLITYGLIWMARLVHHLGAIRRQLAEAALASTRLRLAQDLHDLLGLSLSAITLTCDLAHRLIARDPDRARAVLGQAMEISHHALTEARTVAGDRHQMSLEAECVTTRALLVAAGLDVTMEVRQADGELPAEVGTVLAMVLREGVTNVLRHSTGRLCEITVTHEGGQARLRIVNDGEPGEADRQGSGIRNMSERVAALGGVLVAGPGDDGRFVLSASIPRASGDEPDTTS